MRHRNPLRQRQRMDIEDPETRAQNDLIIKRLASFPPEIRASLTEALVKNMTPEQRAEFDRRMREA